jgi:hypothetical protein
MEAGSLLDDELVGFGANFSRLTLAWALMVAYRKGLIAALGFFLAEFGELGGFFHLFGGD